VLATLEAIVADPNIFAAAGDVRTALYRFFLKVWDSMPVNGHLDQAGFSCDELGACGLASLYLLSAIEGFATAEVADTLECSIAEASSLIDAAGREIADQIRTDVLIIEDEPFIALGLEILVAELGHRTVSVARTHREAVKAARRERPGLILADVQLADGSSGLEAVNQVLGDFSVPVIFITGYPERFLTGTRPEPAFLITKPFRLDSLKAIISQALFFDRKSHRKDKSEAITLSSDHTGRGESMFPCLDHSG
jgi:CheY-like chemotaxis protein